MSADNGIYILETNAAPNGKLNGEKEYRVKHLQVIDNIRYDENAPKPIKPEGSHKSYNEYDPKDETHCNYQRAYRIKFYNDDPDVHIRNARDMWKDCKVFNNKVNAMQCACNIEKQIMGDNMCPILEYGISFIRIDRVF